MSDDDDSNGFWELVDTIFEAAAKKGVPAITLTAAAMNAACFSAHMMNATREDFLSIALAAWDDTLLQIRYIRAAEDLIKGKCAKA